MVKTQKEAQHEQIATRVLYEIQEAGTVILDPFRRKQYDAFLEQSKTPSKQRQIPEPFPPHQPYKPVGEGSELVRSYFGIVSILLAAFIIMAAASFYLPWQKVVFNRSEKEEPSNQQIVPVANPQAAIVAQAQQPQVAVPIVIDPLVRQGAVPKKGDQSEEPVRLPLAPPCR